MEYSLQIDLAICLNTEYVWTKRTKNEECSLECSSFLLCCESMQEHHIQKLTHHRTAVFERRNIRSDCWQMLAFRLNHGVCFDESSFDFIFLAESGTSFFSYVSHTFILSSSSIWRITFAGTPAAMLFGGTSLFTTAPAATMLFSPMVTPPQIVALEHIQQLSSITIGEAYSRSCLPSG